MCRDIERYAAVERTAGKYYGETAPQAHAGGVSFDLLCPVRTDED